jgi:uncharacterized oxidoreductase
MEMTGNTILITGGGSGIGRGLAEAFQSLGNQVIIAGRRKQLLDETVAANPGMKSAVLDIANGDSVRSFAAQIKKEYPKLNVVIHNAGIMRMENLQAAKPGDAEEIIAINLLGPMRLTSELLPQLLAQPKAAIITVTSGLAFVPLTMTPSYCASKAALHSYTQSLRYQLKDTSVQVVELIPPYVQTELGGARQASDPRAMPLAEFIAESMAVLKNSPDADETYGERVKGLRFDEASGSYDGIFKGLNEGMAASMAATRN